MEKYLYLTKEGDCMGLTSKQKDVVRCVEIDNPKILICSGAKRA